MMLDGMLFAGCAVIFFIDRLAPMCKQGWGVGYKKGAVPYLTQLHCNL